MNVSRIQRTCFGALALIGAGGVACYNGYFVELFDELFQLAVGRRIDQTTRQQAALMTAVSAAVFSLGAGLLLFRRPSGRLERLAGIAAAVLLFLAALAGGGAALVCQAAFSQLAAAENAAESARRWLGNPWAAGLNEAARWAMLMAGIAIAAMPLASQQRGQRSWVGAVFLPVGLILAAAKFTSWWAVVRLEDTLPTVTPPSLMASLLSLLIAGEALSALALGLLAVFLMWRTLAPDEA